MPRWTFALLATVLSLALVPPQEEPATKPASPQIGQKAPAIRLNDHEGKAVTVGQPTGESWTVLAFYPKAATPG